MQLTAPLIWYSGDVIGLNICGAGEVPTGTYNNISKRRDQNKNMPTLLWIQLEYNESQHRKASTYLLLGFE